MTNSSQKTIQEQTRPELTVVRSRGERLSIALAAVEKRTEQILRICHSVWIWRRWVVLIATPLLCLPIPFLYTSSAGRCTYTLLIMGTFWITEVIPIAITALLPVILFPLLGVMKVKTAAHLYFSDTALLLICGLMVAIAIEKWNLHKRIALRLLMLLGTTPPLLMLGFMIVTSLLSMFISNTATTSMMTPIAYAVITELERHQGQHRPAAGEANDRTPLENELDSASSNHPTVTNVNNQKITVSSRKRDALNFDRLRKGLLLSVCYAANIGGTGMLTGSGSNFVFKGMMDELYGKEAAVTFTSWFVVGFPNAVLLLLLCWGWMQLYSLGPRHMVCCYFRRRKSQERHVAQVIRDEYERLGKIRFSEIAVLVHFVALVVLWFTSEPEIFPGWAAAFKPGYVSDGMAAALVAMMLFIVPSSLPVLKRKSQPNDAEGGRSFSTTCPQPESSTLLDWRTVHRKMAWGLVLLLGGGFALAEGCKVSGLSSGISRAMNSMGELPRPAVNLVLCLVMAAATEVTSNAATVAVALPIVSNLAQSLGVHPAYFMLSVTFSASFAFMLPVATPPNAIVFAYGHLKILDMVKAGLMMNVICVLILQCSMNTYGSAFLGLATFPTWAQDMATVAGMSLSNATQPTTPY